MWVVRTNGEKEYLAGSSDWAGAAREAERCSIVTEDLEEELVVDERRSC